MANGRCPAGQPPATSAPPGQPPGQAPGGKAYRWQAQVGKAYRRQTPHGGTSTGARTPEGLASLARAHTRHGDWGAAARAQHRAQRTVIIRPLVIAAAMRLRPYLPRELKARMTLGAGELAASPRQSLPQAAPRLRPARRGEQLKFPARTPYA